MEKLKFNKHYIGKCYINFYNLEPEFLEDLIYYLKRWLNYKDGRGGIESSEVKMYLICKGGYFFWSGFEPNPDEGCINCGDNEELFIALAALRDDTDDYQWFVWDDIEDEGEKFKQYIPGEPWQDWWWFEVHKATPAELIEYFIE